ncbi:hypothetical protein AXF42_Ash000068 [Apostasia shenzhenica]|uniref:Uncharacterized protein n=1 Tax=Apostasia shenzhenica TaxID=1088818 RepID=A0A2I0AFE0_9ASPA|nr:hypothetical protein AXF42_Ash000068 [Apostasia shenzhenica]
MAASPCPRLICWPSLPNLDPASVAESAHDARAHRPRQSSPASAGARLPGDGSKEVGFDQLNNEELAEEFKQPLLQQKMNAA